MIKKPNTVQRLVVKLGTAIKLGKQQMSISTLAGLEEALRLLSYEVQEEMRFRGWKRKKD